MPRPASTTSTIVDGMVESNVDVSASPYYSHDMAPTPRAERRWGMKDIAVLWISHVGLHPDLHARLVADRRRDELVAGGADDLPRQRHRAGADGAQRPRGHEVRHPVSGLLPGDVRHPRRQRAGAAAGARGLRLVRHPDVDRRLGDLQDRRSIFCAGAGTRLRAACRSRDQRRRSSPCFLVFWVVNMLRSSTTGSSRSACC